LKGYFPEFPIIDCPHCLIDNFAGDLFNLKEGDLKCGECDEK